MYGIESLLAGRTLVDRYRVEEVIGRGGMGAVYRARDLRLGRPVAIKVVTVAAPDPDAHRRLRARFHREARAAAGLHHPNVVAVYDFGTDPELSLDFLVMELLRGEDLASCLARRGPLPLPTASAVLYQTARGLAAGHRAGLIHRDVKPGNIFLEPGDRAGDLHVKVLDFGIADIGTMEDATVTQLTVVGKSPFSPAFASPEQMRGESRLTPATDVFSLGATAFQLLTGQRAFTSPDPRQMVVELSRSVANVLPRVPGLTPELRAVIQKALAPFPEDRFPHAGALVEALAPLVGEKEGHRYDTNQGMERAGGWERSLPEPEIGPAARSTTGTRMYEPLAARPATSETRMAEELQNLQQHGVRQAGPPASPASGPAPHRPRWYRRAATALWNFVLTAASVGLFVGSWGLAINGLQEQDLQLVYLGAAASVFFTPLAIHRLLGGRGRLGLALFGSLIASAATVYFLASEDQPVEYVLGAMFLAQVILCFGAESVSRRPALPEEDALPVNR